MDEQVSYPIVPTLVVFRCAIRDQEGKYLLLLRADGNESMLGKWELPGGKIERDEDPFEGLKREVFEETGLRIIWVYPTVYLKTRKIKEGPHTGATVMNIVGETDQYEGTIVLSEDHNQYKWSNKEEALKLELTNDTKEMFEYLEYGR